MGFFLRSHLRAGVAVWLIFCGSAQAYTLNGYTFNDGPSQTAKPNIAVMVHGNTSSPGSWPVGMESSINTQLNAFGRAGQWDTWRYDWQTDAAGGGTVPSDAKERAAQVHGQHLGDWLIQQTAGGGYDHIHLMGHSLGGRVIETAAVKLRQAGITLHQTFLDPYTPKVWEAVYGENADYAENYFFDKPLDGGISNLDDSFNNSWNHNVNGYSGAPSPYNPFSAGAWHDWPHQWYDRTVDNPTGFTEGFRHSKEFVGDSWQHPAGHLDGTGSGGPGRRVTRARANYNTIASSGDELTLTAGQTLNLTLNTSGAGSTNYLEFRWDFASRAGGQLTVSVDGVALTHVQEAFSLSGSEWSGKLMYGSDLGAGNHTISFTLAGGDSVMLDDISLGYYREIGSTVAGDTNYNGIVDATDLQKLASFYGQPFGMDWDRADFNYDGATNLTDLGMLARNWSGAPGSFELAMEQAFSIPEPAGFLVLTALGLMLRRRYRLA